MATLKFTLGKKASEGKPCTLITEQKKCDTAEINEHELSIINLENITEESTQRASPLPYITVPNERQKKIKLMHIPILTCYKVTIVSYIANVITSM